MKLQNIVPPGIDGKTELKWIAAGLIPAVLISMDFLLEYLSARSDLYYRSYPDGELILREGAFMTPFEILIADKFAGFQVGLLLLMILAVWHYIYHYQGSRSMWLMRRLPRRTELHKRCLMLPVLAAAGIVLIAAVLCGIYYQVYVLCTPVQCLIIR